MSEQGDVQADEGATAPMGQPEPGPPEEDVAVWVQFSDEDLDMARLAFGNARWRHAVVFCQQAVEKRLKGLLVHMTGQVPERTHDLLALAGSSGLALTEDRQALLLALSRLYVTARYPRGSVEALTVADRGDAERYLMLAEEVIAWVDLRMPPHGKLSGP